RPPVRTAFRGGGLRGRVARNLERLVVVRGLDADGRGVPDCRHGADAGGDARAFVRRRDRLREDRTGADRVVRPGVPWRATEPAGQCGGADRHLRGAADVDADASPRAGDLARTRARIRRRVHAGPGGALDARLAARLALAHGDSSTWWR